MSAFNPDTFLETTMDKANETAFVPIPEGEFHGIIYKVEGRKTSKGSPILRVTFSLDDRDVREQLNRDELIVNYDLFLDLNEQGGLAFGPNQNVRLGQLRAAVGQNKDGKAWSPRMLEGAGPVLVSVSQRPNEDDPSIIYNDVRRVTAI